MGSKDELLVQMDYRMYYVSNPLSLDDVYSGLSP
jgi:hypothetical protein